MAADEPDGIGNRLDLLLAGVAATTTASLQAQLRELTELRQAVRSDLAAVMSAAPEDAIDQDIVAAGLRRRLLRLDEAEDAVNRQRGLVRRRLAPLREGD